MQYLYLMNLMKVRWVGNLAQKTSPKKKHAVVYYFQCVQFKFNQMETTLGLQYMHIIVVGHLPAISEY